MILVSLVLHLIDFYLIVLLKDMASVCISCDYILLLRVLTMSFM